MWKGKLIVIFGFIAFLTFIGITPSFSQKKSKDQLKKEKQEKIKRIQEVEKILNETSNKKDHSLGELIAINQRIKEQEGLMNSIRSEIGYLNAEIEENRSIVSSLEQDIDQLKKEYASMVYAAQKSSNGLDKLTFLFSSGSFSQMRARWKYMEQYAEARRRQTEQILLVAQMLSVQISQIEVIRTEKQALLNDQINQNQQLVKLKDKRSQIVASLESQQSKLKDDLNQQKLALKNLETKITDAINAEIAAAAAEKVKASPASTKNEALSGSFAQNKTKLSWPVDGFISQKFGRQNHAALKGVVTENDGISIQTKQNEVAKAIFEGDVRFVFFIPSMGYSALIRHGEYFTVYSGLKEPLVKPGDKVKIGQILGEVVTKPEGVTELWFEIRKGRDPLNPEQWLVKR